MATPFKRICLRASQIQPSQQWRPLSTSAARHASPNTPSSQGNTINPSDKDLDNLLRRPGVKYTTTTAPPDTDLANYQPADLSSLAHRELAQHSELRELARLAAWEMPRLTALAQTSNYIPEKEKAVLRWRYTTYMGESHPAARKVVVTFNPFSLPQLAGDDKATQKLLKLAGARYNPTKREVKMSCESFETSAQNKRYLADTIAKLVAEATDKEADGFEDVPLDLRHHKPPIKHRFPQEWVMTAERRMQLEGARRAAMLGEAKRIESGEVSDGVQAIGEAREVADREVEAREAVMVEAGGSRGKQGSRR